MPRRITDVFASLVFARKIIAEVQASVLTRPDVVVDTDRYWILQENVLPPLVLKERKVFFSKTQQIPVVFYLWAMDGEFFKKIHGSPENPDDLRGVWTLRLNIEIEDAPVLEFSIFVNSDLCDPASHSSLVLRSETIASEFFCCWLGYEEITAGLKATNEGEAFSPRFWPQKHSERWSIDRLLCPLGELEQLLKRYRFTKWQLYEIVFEQDLKFPASFDDALGAWEKEKRINRDITLRALVGAIHENSMRQLLEKDWIFSSVLKPRKLTIEDLKNSLTIGNLHDFWNAVESRGADGVLGVKFADWKMRAIKLVEDGMYWALIDQIEWGKYFSEIE